MGMYDELDDMIKERCNNINPETATQKELEQYYQFKDEIEEHFAGNLEFNQLSPSAQDLIRDWESLIEARMNDEYNRAEMSDDYKIGPLDV
jgi:hypothetical protein